MARARNFASIVAILSPALLHPPTRCSFLTWTYVLLVSYHECQWTHCHPITSFRLCRRNIMFKQKKNISDTKSRMQQKETHTSQTPAVFCFCLLSCFINIWYCVRSLASMSEIHVFLLRLHLHSLLPLDPETLSQPTEYKMPLNERYLFVVSKMVNVIPWFALFIAGVCL
jgi:hypothetical protein